MTVGRRDSEGFKVVTGPRVGKDGPCAPGTADGND